MIAKLIRKLFGKKDKEWWQEPEYGYLHPYLESKYGQPGTEQGDKPVGQQDERGQSILILPRWYKDHGYQQPNKESHF